MLQTLLEQHQQTQQVVEQERRNRELGNKDFSLKITQLCQVLEQQKQFLATNQQTFKGELIQEVTKKIECGVPSAVEKEMEIKNEPPGLTMGGDDRGLGARSEPPNERNEDKGPKENYCPRETDSHMTEKVNAEEMQKILRKTVCGVDKMV